VSNFPSLDFKNTNICYLLINTIHLLGNRSISIGSNYAFSKISAIVYAWIMKPRTISSIQIQALLIPSVDYITEKVNIFLEFHVIYNLILILLCSDHKRRHLNFLVILYFYLHYYTRMQTQIIEELEAKMYLHKFYLLITNKTLYSHMVQRI
jgi:hypothetical protein